jgi:hypothetical protein
VAQNGSFGYFFFEIFCYSFLFGVFDFLGLDLRNTLTIQIFCDSEPAHFVESPTRTKETKMMRTHQFLFLFFDMSTQEGEGDSN